MMVRRELRFAFPGLRILRTAIADRGSVSRQSNRQPDGGEETAGVGFSLPGDIAGGAMIDAGANDGNAESRVDGRIKGECFDRDVALIVIHADEGVGTRPRWR